MNKKFLPLILLLISYASIAQKTEIQYLSGLDKDRTVEWEFYVTEGQNSGKWTTIPVPSQWELQGFGTYNYGREKPEKHADEKGMYRYNFEVPDDWKRKSVNIVFEGSMTDTEVKINGKPAGPIHQGSFYRFKYDISKLLNYGKDNLLEVTVSKKSSNESVNEAERYADYWIFGGIFRPVYLEALPKEHIERFAVDAKADGSFYIDVFLEGIRKANQVAVQIFTLDNQPVGEKFSQSIEKGDQKTNLTVQVDNINTWTPETPNLYQVKVQLKDDQELQHEIADRFGFRTVELRAGDGIYVNDVKVIFRGVNRHSFWPTSGRTTSKKLSIQDIQLMKDMNMNAVRMSHYPPDVHFLNAADSLGIFVLDELAGWQQAYDTEVGKILVEEMITRDVNHPSIVVWDNGNEGGNNFELDDDFHLYDPQKRPLIHPWAIFRDTDTQHYKDYNCCTGTLFHGRDVFFPTEFLHGLFDGGHGAGLEDFWNLMMENPLSAGGFLWVFADEGVVRTDQDGRVDVFGSNAPDGIVGPYREKEGSFYTIKELWSPVQIQMKQITPQFNGKISVENRFLYTNFNQIKFEWKLADFPAPNDNQTGHLVKKQGNPAVQSIAPGEKSWLKLDLPNDWNKYDLLTLTAWEPSGREIYTWTWPIATPKEKVSELLSDRAENVMVREEEGFVYLSAGNTEIRIDKQKGLIDQVMANGQEVSFKNGPQLATGTYNVNDVVIREEGENQVIEVNYEGDFLSTKYTMLPSGWLKMEYAYLNQGHFDFMGINFDYPEDKVNGVKWLGQGPYRVWKNRTKGVTYNVWQKDYNNTVTGESWDYPEFKGYHANLYWAVLDTDEVPITIASANQDLYLRLYTPAAPEGAFNENTNPPFPEGDISLMHGISPIGTKFKEPSRLGPQSRPNQFSRMGRPGNSLNATVYFYFGELD